MHSNYHQKWYSDSATGGPVERIPGVVDQWERIDIFYRNTGSEARKEWIHALDTPILQYIISKKGKRIKDAFDTQGISWRFYSSGNVRSFHFIFNKDSTQDEISQILKEKFEKEIVRDVESMAVKVSANVTDRIKSKLRNLSLETEKLKAVYFDTKNGYLTCVADNDSHLNELLMDIGYEDEEKIRLNDISAQVLQDLQFEQAVKTSHPRLKCITFADENDSVTLLWQGKKETSGSELLAKFKGKIRDCVVLENAINAKHIVFNTRAGGRVNDTFVEYIKEMTKQSLNTPAIPLFTFDFSLKRITLYTLDNVKAIQEIVNQSIIERQLDPETAKHFFKGGSSLDFCKKATDERKLLYDININGIVCIKSVQKDLDDLINQAIPYKEEPLDLSELQVSFLKQYGSQLMEQVEKRYDIAVKLENNRCLFRGKDSQLLQKGKEFMVDSLKKLLTHMSIKTNEVAVLKLKEGIENVVAENNCKWNLNFTNEFCNTDLNKYLGAWHDPLAHIITCVQNVDNGDMVAADLVIELTTSNLFPLSKHFTKENPLVGRSTAGKIFSVMHEEILEGPFQKDAFCCQSMFAFVICSSYSPGMQYQFISFQQLKKCYLRALQYADENGMKSLALSTKLLQSPALENDITPAILAAAFEFVEANHQHDIRKLTLCCDKENCHDVCDTVENLYDKRKGYRRILSLPSEPNKQNAVISLNVKVGSITDSKRDVIVNTVNIKLDFAKGQVSKKILEKAGPEMQRECNQKYPNGISYDQIAYTCSYNISYTGNVKYLFHGALPEYCFQGYEKTVKCFVKRCLYLADRLDCKTLVFPAIGVGKLDYPRRETATAMFEAIEEYPKEAANCGIQEVDIMVFNGDQKSCMNFRDEEWRKLKGGAKHRPKLAEMNEVEAVPYQMLVRNIGEETKVRVAKVGACRIPPFALEIVMREGSMGIKSASKPPKSWNDQIDVCVKCADIQSIDFKKLGKVLFEERITEVFFIADKKDDLPLSEQVIQIANLIKQLSKNPNEVVQLKTCTVFVDEHVEETVMAKDDGWRWTEFVEESALSIELLGQTEECLEKARGSIKQLLMDAKDKDEQLMMDVNKNEDQHLDKEGEWYDQDSEGAESEEMEVEVSAIINPSFISLKKDRLKEWLQFVRNKFSLNAEQMGEDVSVSGNIVSILNFEMYLNTIIGINDELDPIFAEVANKRTQIEIPIDKASYFLLLRKEKLKKYASLTSVNGIHYTDEGELVLRCEERYSNEIQSAIASDLAEIKREYIFFEKEEDIKERKKKFEETDFADDVEIRRTNLALSIASDDRIRLRESFELLIPEHQHLRCLIIGKVKLNFIVGDIRTVKAEFIVISSAAKMTGRKGASKELGKMLGKDFLNNCEKSLAKDGDIKETECREVESGLAYRRWIGHVRLPVNEQKKTTQVEQHTCFQRSILNSFQRAAAMKCTSIAMPCLGSEVNTGGFGIKNCANEYVNAFKKLQPSTLSEISFVDKNENKIQTVFETFDDNVGGKSRFHLETTV
ncbi:uncharacterized protein LOC128211431 isoform X2 [Mya arenaria]|uniref:uncharacterized protein LOC128211431 isoform X2 n=1 Tax=Mya arenaria TaxID=6604 RepID=UPI0022E44F23|nr:uncharacterized protein LOC128211431 isoform X2 [Mya arenaria]